MFEFIYLLVFKPIHLPPAYGQGRSLLATRDKIIVIKKEGIIDISRAKKNDTI